MKLHKIFFTELALLTDKPALLTDLRTLIMASCKTKSKDDGPDVSRDPVSRDAGSDWPVALTRTRPERSVEFEGSC